MRALGKLLMWAALFSWIGTMDDGCARVEQWHKEQLAMHRENAWQNLFPYSR